MKNMSAIKIAILLIWTVFASILAYSDFLYYRNKVMTGEVDFGFFFLLICLHFSYGAIVLKKILTGKESSHQRDLTSLLIFIFFVGIFSIGSASAISSHFYMTLMIAFGAVLLVAKKFR
jgi:peptidoglycan/LPS O-acetylase OafA/YrhL